MPPVIVVTDRGLAAGTGRSLAETVEAVAGIDGVAVLFREKDLDDVERLALGRQVAGAAGTAPLLVAGDHLLAAQLGAAGVHLAAGQSVPAVPPGMLSGRSCHSEADVAGADGRDYVTLGPVAASISKPGYGPAVSAETFAEACEQGIPVFALGGVTADNARQWLRLGAAGVAVCGAVMASDAPAAVVEKLLAAMT